MVSWGFPDGAMVKNPPAKQEMQEAQGQSLGWEDPLEEEMATRSRILPWESQGQKSLTGDNPRGCTESNMTEFSTEHVAE